MTRILLAEDDKSIVSSLTDFLQAEGFAVDAVSGQAAALEKLEEGGYSLMLLDISLADGNGFSVCSMAKRKYKLPIIFLTASGDEGSIVAGLDMGADDYIPKPFRPRELVSRIKNALRRYGAGESVIRLGNVTVDTDKGTAMKNGTQLPLSALEYKILVLFCSNRGKLLSRNRLLEEIWDLGGDFVNDNTLTVYIKRLREKIEDDPGSPAIIKTVRGLGYRVD